MKTIPIDPAKARISPTENQVPVSRSLLVLEFTKACLIDAKPATRKITDTSKYSPMFVSGLKIAS
jgi:hypothetical protein